MERAEEPHDKPATPQLWSGLRNMSAQQDMKRSKTNHFPSSLSFSLSLAFFLSHFLSFCPKSCYTTAKE